MREKRQCIPSQSPTNERFSFANNPRPVQRLLAFSGLSLPRIPTSRPKASARSRRGGDARPRGGRGCCRGRAGGRADADLSRGLLVRRPGHHTPPYGRRSHRGGVRAGLGCGTLLRGAARPRPYSLACG